MKDYKETLLMMKTDFPMRANLGINEVSIQKTWEDKKIYEKVLAKNLGNKPFYLHDGPPYANGPIHIGHALNKILKDFIIRYNTMCGYYTPYQPGWDTHGLPIESALSKNKSINRKAMSVADFRSLCKEYALKQIDIQRIGFKRLGVLGEWDNPYITLDPKYEAAQLKVFAEMADKGLIFKGLKPVYWSPSSETALAEAEIEYEDVKSPAIFVAFKVVNGNDLLSDNCELVIWTTTPWTIPANLAICANARFTYVVIKANERYFVLAKDLVDSFVKKIKVDEYDIVREFKGTDLLGVTYKHPLYDRVSPVILGDHVTLETGSGLVHTAPGHGADDFIVGKEYGLDILCPVDARGYMTEEAGEFAGLFVDDCSKAVTKRLEEVGALLDLSFITHSYPHDWRTKKPIIFRATPQWFASIEKFKDAIIEAISGVTWYPNWGEIRISNMIRDRKDWCISRQRTWGVPIPVFYAENGEVILNKEVIYHVADIFEKEGSNAWFEKDASELLPKGFKHPGSPNNIFTKETDIMDVWFDSGSSHKSAFEAHFNTYPADVYLEGTDQYRGWFNSSISTAVATCGMAPFKTVITHGFTLDGEGFKMSKSLGNTIDPIAVCNESGADILRLWATSVDYQSDSRISKAIINQNSETYRKIRNTFRFMLGNIFDFDPENDMISYQNLPEIDQYMLCSLNNVLDKVNQAYQKYNFTEVLRIILNYMTNDLSAFYLDFTKDILYIEKADSLERRSIQTVIYKTLITLSTLLTPIIPHTTEEVYQYMPGNKQESIYLCNIPEVSIYHNSNELLKKYSEFMKFRDDILKALEEARNNKIIGKSFNAKLTICPNNKTQKLLSELNINLAQVFIVSKLEIVDNLDNGSNYDSGVILVEPAQGITCSRCWQIVDHVNEDELCERCQKVINK